MEGPPEKVSASKDIDKLYSAFADLRLKARTGEFLPGERSALEKIQTDIKALELEELHQNPELEKLLNTFLKHCERARSLATTLDAMRRYARVLEVEQNGELLNVTLRNYDELMGEFKSLEEEIEDNIRLLVEQRKTQRGLLMIASDALEPVQPLFVDQDEKDIVFKKLVKPIEFVSENTLPPRSLRDTQEIPRRPASLSASHVSHRDTWKLLKQKMLPSVHAYHEVCNRFQAGLCSEADVRAAHGYKALTHQRIQEHLDTHRGLTLSEILELKARVRNVMQPDEPILTVAPASAPTPPISAVREAHEKVRAAYASVQHTLSVEQRIQMRKQIAELSSLVRQAELAHTVSVATEHAPALAHATLASEK
jgi:hypothetical protein